MYIDNRIIVLLTSFKNFLNLKTKRNLKTNNSMKHKRCILDHRK